MGNKRDTFVLKASYFSAFRHKLTFEQKGHLLDAIYAYHLGEDYEAHLEDSAVDMAFSFIREFAEMCKRNYEEVSQKNSANAKERWEKQRNNAKDANGCELMRTHKTDAKRCLTDTDTKSDTDTDTKSDTDRESNPLTPFKGGTPSKRFIKPTIQEIDTYCKERKNGINASAFFDYYESKGWKIRGDSMKDWKAAVRNWERRDQQKDQPKRQLTYNDLHPIGTFENEYTKI